MTEVSARRYRLHPPDGLGVLFGLDGLQLGVLAVAMLTGVLLAAYATAIAGVAVVMVGGAAGLWRVNGQPLLASIPSAVRWARGRAAGEDRWFAPVPLYCDPSGEQPALPAPLAGQTLLSVDAAAAQVGAGMARVAVVHDERGDMWAATVRVSGRRFALLEPADQDRLVQWWGTALAAFCTERTPVAAVRWTQWSAAAGSRQQRDYLDEHVADDAVPEARAAYEQLLAEAGPLATTHEVLVTLVVAGGRVAVARQQHDRQRAVVETLLNEVGLFARRLEAAGLVVSSPLSPTELARALRVRLDPTCAPVLDQQRRTLGDRAGLVLPRNAGPLATQTAWTHWRADGSHHRAFVVARWPLLEVPANWMQDLLLHTGAVRSVTVSYEPIPHSTSQRRVLREAARLEADADQRQSKGFRVGARHRRASAAVDEREEELVAGFGELDYAGVVVVTAPGLDELDRACAETVQVAASCGVELRPLDGRHDQAVGVSLPLARGLAPRAVTA